MVGYYRLLGAGILCPRKSGHSVPFNLQQKPMLFSVVQLFLPL